MKSYPYISTKSNNLLFYAKDTATPIGDESNFFSHGFKVTVDESDFENNTREYLANTYGEVASPEHAEFIIELCENNEIKTKAYRYSAMSFFMIVDGELYFYSDKTMPLRNKCKQITIPLPPKADKQEASEWPQVGDEVTWGKKSVKGEVKALSDGLAWIKNEYGNHYTEYVNSLVKPKTPEEELRDELIEYLNELGSSARYCFGGNELAADELLKSYDIKKKPQ